MPEITDFSLEIVDPNEEPHVWSEEALFGLARENDYLIAKSTFRVGGERAASIMCLSREIVADNAMDIDAYCKAASQNWADSNPASPAGGCNEDAERNT